MPTENRILCEVCQREIRESVLNAHQRSAPHLRAVKIAELLEKRDMSYAAIAAEVGVSREYVRLFAKKRGYAYPEDLPAPVPPEFKKNPVEFFRQAGALGGARRTKRKIEAARRNLKKGRRIRAQLQKGAGPKE